MGPTFRAANSTSTRKKSNSHTANLTTKGANYPGKVKGRCDKKANLWGKKNGGTSLMANWGSTREETNSGGKANFPWVASYPHHLTLSPYYFLSRITCYFLRITFITIILYWYILISFIVIFYITPSYPEFAVTCGEAAGWAGCQGC